VFLLAAKLLPLATPTSFEIRNIAVYKRQASSDSSRGKFGVLFSNIVVSLILASVYSEEFDFAFLKANEMAYLPIFSSDVKHHFISFPNSRPNPIYDTGLEK